MYSFYFVGGTCGSFVKKVFEIYLFDQNNLHIDITGHAHNLSSINYFAHYHVWEDVPKQDRIVAIDFDEDDIDIIIQMEYEKRSKEWLVSNWKQAQETYCELKDYDNFDNMPDSVWFEIQKPALESWCYEQPWDEVDLKITFKTVWQGDLNRIISEYINKPLSQKAQKYIDEYRKINHALYSR